MFLFSEKRNALCRHLYTLAWTCVPFTPPHPPSAFCVITMNPSKERHGRDAVHPPFSGRHGAREREVAVRGPRASGSAAPSPQTGEQSALPKHSNASAGKRMRPTSTPMCPAKKATPPPVGEDPLQLILREMQTISRRVSALEAGGSAPVTQTVAPPEGGAPPPGRGTPSQQRWLGR